MQNITNEITVSLAGNLLLGSEAESRAAMGCPSPAWDPPSAFGKEV